MDKLDSASPKNAGLASVNLSYKSVNIASERHDYKLLARVMVRGIAAPSGTLQIFWPSFLPMKISSSNNHTEGVSDIGDNIERRALMFETPRLLPDVPVHILGGESGPQLTYFVDTNLYQTHIQRLNDCKVLRYRLMLDFGAPVEGSLSLSELQKF